MNKSYEQKRNEILIRMESHVEEFKNLIFRHGVVPINGDDKNHEISEEMFDEQDKAFLKMTELEQELFDLQAQLITKQDIH